MKLECEKDIAAFKGKNWREKMALRKTAEDRDPWILRLKLLNYFLVLAPMASLSFWLAYHFLPHFPSLAGMALLVILGWPIEVMVNSLVIVPRIRKALDSNTGPMI